ncbi:META and DUF4377 domain-containing protein [Chitiniphilus eburneus]|uniref:DUF4377 domain-containing protein n=1 Tax=Chitiniphilus eburneus TaxID=2571148 RepID=A0A4U0PZH8_9NEIS|nr:META and DUF4377 domain-containing protein [Chitiniphilus eburneus]TJZ74027.1 DUF4377 domain-containing protein [Chitiniphilus eburneus]
MRIPLLIAAIGAASLVQIAQARSLLDGDYAITRVVVEGRVQRPVDNRLEVHIDGDRISGYSGCNRFMGRIHYMNARIEVGPLAGTRMACLDQERQMLEHDVLAALQAAESFGLVSERKAVVLRGTKGELIELTRGAAGTEKVLRIAAETRPCSGVGKMECLQVRESPEQDWQLLYQGIEGFEPQPGVAYIVRVREERVDNPPADAPDRRLVLIEVLQETR